MHEKDLPLKSARASEFVQRERAANWRPAPGELFQDNLHPYEDTNKQAIENVLSGKAELAKHFAQVFGHSNANLYSYARVLLVYCAHQNEIFEMFDINEKRRDYLTRAETLLRDLLRKIAFDEDQDLLTERLRRTLSANEPDTRLVERLRAEITAAWPKRGIVDREDQERYFMAREEHLDYIHRRDERLTLLARARSTLAAISTSL